MRTQSQYGTPSISASAYFHGRQCCPHCHDILVAPTYSEFVVGGEIRHYWSCETCGLVSQTHIGCPRIRWTE